MRLAPCWFLMILLVPQATRAAQLYDNGPCCIDEAAFSDQERVVWQADDVTLEAAVTIGGIRFYGLYVDAEGSLVTNSVPRNDAFIFRMFVDDGGQPGSLVGQSTLTGSRAETGETFATTSILWHRYELALDTPISVAAGVYWISVVNDTTTDVDDDWAWGLTNESPQLAASTDEGASWVETGRNGNLAFVLFDGGGIASLGITKTVLDEAAQPVTTAQVGDRLVYHIEVSNDSDETAAGVVITDTLPEDVVLVDVASTPPVTPMQTGGTVRWDVGSLPATEPDNIFNAELTVDVAASADGKLVDNRASISEVAEPFFSGASASASFEASNPEAVTIVKEVMRDGEVTGVAAAGDRLSYVLTVTNLGSVARDVIVTDVLPDEISYVGDSGGYDPGSGVWAVGSLGPDSPDNEASLSIDVDVLAAVEGNEVTNRATITSLDGAAANILDTATVSGFGADLHLEAAGVRTTGGDIVDDVAGGALGHFRYRLTNNGPETTTNVSSLSFRELYAPELNFIGFTELSVFDTPDFTGPSRQPTGSTGSSCALVSGLWSCPLERPGGRNVLEPGETISLEVSIQMPLVLQDVSLSVETDSSSLPADPVASNSGVAQAITVLRTEPQGANDDDDRCFIATAAYGSYLEPEVVLLRRFRDRYLLTNAPGRMFVAWYYHNSPALAAIIAREPALRFITRWALSPAVYTIKYPSYAAGLLAALALVLARRSRRRPPGPA